jgi:Cu/Ag efflux protein CusF
MTISLKHLLATAALAAFSVSTWAQGADMTEGEVRKIDKAQSKITLKHAEIKSLDMPPMTMVFNVKDKAVLDSLQPGDKVKFKAVNEAGKFTVTDLQVVR